jgi:hypothetical protein
MRLYYGFKYADGEHTTWANTRFIAGGVYIFATKVERDAWIAARFENEGASAKKRIPVNKKQAITMCGKETFYSVLETYEYNKA